MKTITLDGIECELVPIQKEEKEIGITSYCEMISDSGDVKLSVLLDDNGSINSEWASIEVNGDNIDNPDWIRGLRSYLNTGLWVDANLTDKEIVNDWSDELRNEVKEVLNKATQLKWI